VALSSSASESLQLSEQRACSTPCPVLCRPVGAGAFRATTRQVADLPASGSPYASTCRCAGFLLWPSRPVRVPSHGAAPWMVRPLRAAHGAFDSARSSWWDSSSEGSAAVGSCATSRAAADGQP